LAESVAPPLAIPDDARNQSPLLQDQTSTTQPHFERFNGPI
jgi:hypothetical protein